MFGSRPPRRGSSIPAWDILRFSGSRPFNGWLAGPPIWLACHHFNATRPCRSLLTDNAVKCPHPHKQFAPRWRAYVPLWDECGTRTFTIICQRYEDQLMAIPHLAPVWVAKMPARGEPIRVWLKEWARHTPPITRGEMKPQDLRPFLLQLWNDNELKEWFAANPPGTLPVVGHYAAQGAAAFDGDNGVSAQERNRVNDAFARAASDTHTKNGKGH